MSGGRKLGTIAAAVLAVSIALPPGHTQAAVANLKSVLLRSAEVPSGFTHPQVQVYSHFVSRMEIGVSTSGMKITSACALPTAFARDGWMQGLIQSFDRSAATMSLQLCASRFKTAQGAHLAYRKLVGKELSLLIKTQLASRLPTSGLGDEATGITRNGIGCSCEPPAAAPHTYEIIYRHQNAVVDLTYSGPGSYSSTQFEQLVTRTNARLH